jgi:peptidoglycan/LPS O-acetylase OafA/YrhL
MAASDSSARRSAWARARSLAEQTPEDRNRYVDLLRAISIGLVVLGHWLIAAPHIVEGRLRMDHMLAVDPWTHWLTWLFQVMPVFFVVGGYANAASWEAALRSGQPYGAWVTGRLRRLVGPVLPLLAVWALTAAVARTCGVPLVMIRVGSQAALIPLWFLAVYVLVVLLAPLAHAAWRRFGMASLVFLTAGAVILDLARFSGGWVGLAWGNYLFVWLAVHQLGFLWRDGRIGGVARSLPWAALGGLTLLGLVFFGPYSRSMVGVPGEEVSNTLPPSLAMLALGALQAGLLLALERPARSWLAGVRPWTATVLLNGTIMSVYLWHSTTMIWTIGLANLAGGVGLHVTPGSGAWYLARLPWLAIYLVGLLLALFLFGRFERLTGPRPGTALPTWRACGGALLVCAGLGLLAYHGIGGEGLLGLRWGNLLAVFGGAALLGIVRWPGRN